MVPSTRKMVVSALGVISLAGIVAETVLAIYGAGSDSSFVAITSASLGALAGMAVPRSTSKADDG